MAQTSLLLTQLSQKNENHSKNRPVKRRLFKEPINPFKAKQRIFGPLLLLTLLLNISGCGFLGLSGDKEEASDSPNQYSMHLLKRIEEKDLVAHQEAEATLAEAAASVSQSLYHLAEVERAVHPKAKFSPPPNPVRIGMANRASVDWSGPVAPLLREVAKASHYHLKILGQKPAIPIIVSVTAENVPLADILRDISFQADKQATVALYPSRHIIELRYLSPGRHR